jgi:hydrogenase/urease accessory protein HupE
MKPSRALLNYSLFRSVVCITGTVWARETGAYGTSVMSSEVETSLTNSGTEKSRDSSTSLGMTKMNAKHIFPRWEWVRASVSLLLIVVFFATSLSALAHEIRPAYLELHQTDTDSYDVLWKVPARGDNMRLGIYVEFPSGTTNLTVPRTLFANDASTERWSVKRSGGLRGEKVCISGVAATMTDVLVRLENLDGTTQVTRVTPSSPSFVVGTAPSALNVMATYLVLGVEHILFGVDHLLFVLALLILVKGWRKLVGTITAFTIAHSITLAVATLGIVQVPSKPVEATIALSIVFVACEIVHQRQDRSGLTERWPWIIAFSFGLLHGLGFASALREVGLPQNAIPLALLFFNVGVEVGQLLFISAVMAVITLVVREARKFSRRSVAPQSAFAWCQNISAYTIGGVAAFWLIQRTLSFVV